MARLHKWNEKLWEFQTEMEPKWRELQRRVADAEERVRQDDGVLEELMQASREKQREEETPASGELALSRAMAMVGNRGQEMVQVLEEVQDEGTRTRLNLLIVEASKIEGALQQQGGNHGNAAIYDITADEGEGGEDEDKQGAPEKKTKKRKKGVARKKKDDRPEKAAASSEVAGKPIQSNKADADLGEEARQLAHRGRGGSECGSTGSGDTQIGRGGIGRTNALPH